MTKQNQTKSIDMNDNLSLNEVLKTEESILDHSLISLIRNEIQNNENSKGSFKAILSIIENLKMYNNNSSNNNINNLINSRENASNDLDYHISNNNNNAINNNNHNRNDTINAPSLTLKNNIIKSVNDSLLVSNSFNLKKEIEKYIHSIQNLEKKMNDIKNVFESKRATTTSTTTAAITIDADNIKNIENKRVDNHTTLLDSQSIVDKKSTSMIKMYYQPKRNKPTKYSKGHCNKPFNIDCFCDICCKVFSRKYDRDRHYRIHLNIYPYSCKVCYKRFIRSDYVINHVRTTSCGQSDYYIDKYKQSSIKTKK